MSLIVKSNISSDPAQIVEAFGVEPVLKRDVENDNLHQNGGKVVGLNLLYDLSSQLSVRLSSILVDLKTKTDILMDGHLSNSFNLEHIMSSICSLSDDIDTLNNIFGGVFPDRAVKFRGFSSTLPASGIITLNGLEYHLSDFNEDNNGDIFYYRDIKKNEVTGLNEGIIYAYVYIDGMLKEDKFDSTLAISSHFEKLGYGFYNNLSTLIKDGMIADDAAIKQFKIEGLTTNFDDIYSKINYLSNQHDTLSDDLSGHIDYLSSQIRSKLNNDFSGFATIGLVNQVSSALSGEFLNYLPKNRVVQKSSISELQEEDQESTSLVPSIKTLSGSLQGFARIGHTHITSDVLGLQNELDSKINTGNIDTAMPTKAENNRVPSTSLLSAMIKSLQDRIDVLEKADVAAAIFNAIYPVGSIVLRIESMDKPFGNNTIGEWTKIGSGKCIWGADSTHNAGDSISQSLPKLENVDISLAGFTTGASGQHSHWYDSPGSRGNRCTHHSGASVVTGGAAAYTISAGEHSHSISGSGKITMRSGVFSGSVVQPPAIAVDIWKRTEL